MLGPDIVVKDSTGTPVFAVEIKNSRKPLEDSADLLRDWSTKSLFGAKPFALISSRMGYFWKDLTERTASNPDVSFPTDEILKRYLNQSRQPRESELEFAVFQWLLDLTAAREPQQLLPETTRLLGSTGLANIIKNGTVSLEAQP